MSDLVRTPKDIIVKPCTPCKSGVVQLILAYSLLDEIHLHVNLPVECYIFYLVRCSQRANTCYTAHEGGTLTTELSGWPS